MKTPTLWLFLLLASTMVRGASFEGRVLLERIEPPKDPETIICSVKGDLVRTEVVRERVKTFITDTEKQETLVILEDDMAYVSLPALSPTPEAPRLEKRAETATILGRSVQKYVVTSEEGEAELWLAEGFGKYTGFGDGFEAPPESTDLDEPMPEGPWAWEWALAGKPLFPLRVVVRDGAGGVILRIETKAITADPLNDRLFSPSPNYKALESWPER